MRPVQLKPIHNVAVAVQTMQLQVCLSAQTDRHFCTAVHSVGSVAGTDNITVQLKDGAPCSETLQTGPEGH